MNARQRKKAFLMRNKMGKKIERCMTLNELRCIMKICRYIIDLEIATGKRLTYRDVTRLHLPHRKINKAISNHVNWHPADQFIERYRTDYRIIAAIVDMANRLDEYREWLRNTGRCRVKYSGPLSSKKNILAIVRKRNRGSVITHLAFSEH